MKTNNDVLMSTLEGHCYKRFHARKNHAKTHGIEFTITLEYVISIVVDTCPILGLPLTWCKQGGLGDASPSLDRIDITKGYVPGNVAWVSNKANTIKNSGSAEEHLAIYLWMKSLHEPGFIARFLQDMSMP